MAPHGWESVIVKFLDVTGAVICGGRSQRFGSDKRLFQYQGKTLLDHSFQKLEETCHETVCVFRDTPPVRLKHYPHIFDDLGVKGPMSGVIAALEYSKTPYVFVLPCDVPKLSIKTFIHLISLRTPEKIIIPYTIRLEPLIAIYPKTFWAPLKVFSHHSQSLKGFILHLGDEKKHIVQMPDTARFKNFNELSNVGS